MKIRLQCEDREKAAKFLKLYDDQVAAGRPTHRVADLFCRKRPGSLRQDFEDWVNIGVMSTQLQTMLTAYQLCNLDDGFQESPHGIITHVAQLARSSKPAHWSAHFRYTQNMEIKRTLDRSHPGRFGTLFEHWRLLFAKTPTFGTARLLHPRKFARCNFLAKVFRYDDYAFHNIEGVKANQSKFLETFTEGMEQIANPGKIIREYLTMMLRPSDIISFVPPSDSNSADVQAAPMPFALEEPPTMLSIVTSRHQALKTIVTQSAVADENAPVPFLVYCYS